MELDGGDTMELDSGAATGRTAPTSGGGGGSGAGEVDRLSALPDSLLHAIMSFLKARQAVQTSVLGARWRGLWRSAPCLDVDQDEFRAAPKPKPPNNHHHHPAPVVDNNFVDWVDDDDEEVDDDEDDNDDTRDIEWDNFEDFADSLMHHCNVAMLDSLRLRVCKSRAPSFADKQAGGWLRRAMKYCTPDPPRQLEGARSTTNSWRLRRLYLCNVALDCRFTMHVSSACRLLEDLELEDCMCAIHAISSNSLKSLVLKNCRWNYLSEIASPTLKSLTISGGSNSSDCVLVIRAPAIAHLCLDVPLRFAKRVAVN